MEKEQSRRPSRLRIYNEFNQLQTIPTGADQFLPLTAHTHGPLVFLGLGPEPGVAAELAAAENNVGYMECPAFEAQMPASWARGIPEHWQRLNPSGNAAQPSLSEFARQIEPALHEGRVFLFTPGLRFFPSFWGPIAGQARWLSLRSAPVQDRAESVFIPHKEEGLLTRELEHGFSSCGRPVRLLTDATNQDALAGALREETPALYCSVNFHGLDPHGERYHMLRAAGCAIAVWCVDNPWHLLSGLKSAFWRDVQLLVTDASFIPELKKHGAAKVAHLPLAAWPELFTAAHDAPQTLPRDLDAGLAFVGRASFPGKGAFFAGLRPPEDLWEKALSMLAAGERPDYHWWRIHLRLTSLWPGKAARQAGCGAEEASQCIRVRCLQHAAAVAPLHVYGDDAWPQLVGYPAAKQARFHPPLDYYKDLAPVYATARYTCNVTSLLLPAGLTQRHFDVWMAGGFLLSDATHGLSLFPKDLTMPITLDGTWGRRTLEQRINALEAQHGLRETLIRAWREYLKAYHTYTHRAAHILELCGLG